MQQRANQRGLLPAPERVDPWLITLPSTPFLTILCDHVGTVRAVAGPEGLLRLASEAGLQLGVCLAEAMAGRNAVGQVLATGAPAAVRGAEHFCHALRGWSAAALPVHRQGQLVGCASVWWPDSQQPLQDLVQLGLQAAAAACLQYLAESDLRWLNLILDDAEDAIRGYLVIDLSGTVLFGTEPAYRLLGIERSRDLSLALPFLWQQARKGARSGGAHEFTLVPPAVPTACTVSVRTLPNRPEQAILTIVPQQAKADGAARNRSGARYSFEDILTVSPNMKEALLTAISVSDQDVPVLLLGESGTGKELVAQAIHRASRRRTGPFVAVNCAAFPRELIVSELFGYEEGAFSGARKNGAQGRFEQANGGTLFLDEIGEMALEHQAMLLRVLEEGHVIRLGGGAPRPIDVRVLAATNLDLWSEVQAGRFRADLYYRLNIVTIHLPPLRERLADVPVLAERFLQREGRAMGRDLTWRPDAIRAMQQYEWPGNIRELYNVVKRAAILAQSSPVGAEVLPWAGRSEPNRTARRRRDIKEVEAVLQDVDCNISEAARKLGVARSTIYRIRKRAKDRG